MLCEWSEPLVRNAGIPLCGTARVCLYVGECFGADVSVPALVILHERDQNIVN